MPKINASIIGNKIQSNSQEAISLNKKSYFGEKEEERIIYSFPEALFLAELGKLESFYKNKKLSTKELFEKLRKLDKNISKKYTVFKDLRKKGHIVKTGLKFGSDFRVYEPGTHPGTSHASWLLNIYSENNKLNWKEIASSVRIAHSTKKRILAAVIDQENKITYYGISWVKK